MKVYIAVTTDQYELPLCVCDTPEELAEALGVTVSAVRCACTPSRTPKHRKHGHKRRYRILRIEI